MWWTWKKSAAFRRRRRCALLPLWLRLPWRRLRLLRPRRLRRLLWRAANPSRRPCPATSMKMENEIPAPKDGKVAQVVVTKGATVGAGDTLVVLA